MIIIKKKKVKRLNKKRTIVFILLLYIVIYFIYYLINQPIKHIEIVGNNLVTDAEILRASKLKDYPSILKYSSRKIRNNILSLDLIDDVKVKKSIGLKIKLIITENKPLFYYKDTKKIVLSNGNIIDNNNKILGIPIFYSTVKSSVLKGFVNSFKDLDDNIIYEINSIYYDPLVNEVRFKIIMNDGNTIIVNNKSVKVINKYNDIYASLNGKSGTISLDSNKLSNIVFIPYEEVIEENVEE